MFLVPGVCRRIQDAGLLVPVGFSRDRCEINGRSYLEFRVYGIRVFGV